VFGGASVRYHKQKGRVTRFASRSTPVVRIITLLAHRVTARASTPLAQQRPFTPPAQPQQPPVIPPPRPTASTCAGHPVPRVQASAPTAYIKTFASPAPGRATPRDENFWLVEQNHSRVFLPFPVRAVSLPVTFKVFLDSASLIP
jgi:hypothetical protein